MLHFDVLTEFVCSQSPLVCLAFLNLDEYIAKSIRHRLKAHLRGLVLALAAHVAEHLHTLLVIARLGAAFPSQP